MARWYSSDVPHGGPKVWRIDFTAATVVRWTRSSFSRGGTTCDEPDITTRFLEPFPGYVDATHTCRVSSPLFTEFKRSY